MSVSRKGSLQSNDEVLLNFSEQWTEIGMVDSEKWIKHNFNPENVQGNLIQLSFWKLVYPKLLSFFFLFFITVLVEVETFIFTNRKTVTGCRTLFLCQSFAPFVLGEKLIGCPEINKVLKMVYF